VRRRLLLPFTSVVIAALAAGACGGGDGSGTGADGPGPVSVVASFYPLSEAVERVGGDRVEVENLTPAGAEPHDLELTTRAIDAIEDADLVVVMGHGFQPAVEDAADRVEGQTVVVLDELSIDAAGKKVADEESSGATASALDPHVWLDPVLMGEVVGAVRDALLQTDPDGASVYEENAATYAAEIHALDREFADGLADCERNVIVTAHEAFGHLAARYGLEQQAIAGISPEQEPTPARLAELADLAEDEGVTTIFTETLVSPDVAETLAREAGGLRTAVLDPLEGLSDEEVAAGADYLSVQRDNLAKLRDALGCR
jgi:zinc transport system substrate-binding protein